MARGEAATLEGGGAGFPTPPMSQSGMPPIGVLIGYFMMVVGMFMAILDIQIVAASLSQIQAGLAASPDEVSWVQTSYLVAEVIMIPLSGFLARGLSTRVLFALSAGGFALSSALCATATSIEQMIAYRALQGFIGGAMIPTVYSASFAMFGRQRQTSVTVLVSLVVTLAPTIGPTLGGWISDQLSWHWLFLVNVIPGVIIASGVWALVDIDEPDFDLLKRVDVEGLLLMAVFLGGLEYVLEEGARNQWFEDRDIVIWTGVTLMTGMGFFYRVFTAEEPIVNLRPFANYNFAAGSLLGAVLGIGLYGLVYIYPLYLARVAYLSSSQIGSILVVTGITMSLSAPVAGVLSRKLDIRLIATLGFLLLASSTYMTRSLTAQWRLHELFLPQVLRGMGLIFCIVSVSTTAFATLPINRLKDGSGLFTLSRNLGGAFGLAVINTIIQGRTNFHWSRLVEHINESRPEVASWLDTLQTRMTSFGVPDPEAGALHQLSLIVQREVLVMSYADCFVLLTYAFVIAACIPPLLRRPQMQGQALGENH